MVVAKGWGTENGELVFNGVDFHFGKIKKLWRQMMEMVANNVNVL